jgi:tRNA-specific 2-thiouridylase
MRTTGDNIQRIGVAMSGGVDSTVTAAMLLARGVEVHGFFMLLPLPELDEQVARVEKTAERLDIPLHLVDVRDRFRQTVIDYFVESYRTGLTPNPCVVCNRGIKCGILMDAVLARSMDAMATGHYARIIRCNGRVLLGRGTDTSKDQSYFLCRLPARRLERLVLPLGGLTKKEVYARAHTLGFTRFDGTESQDVCFLAQGSLEEFLVEQGIAARPGDMVTTDGRVLGCHRGIWKYTVGQRRGLGIPDATPWYVVGLDAGSNQVIIGKNSELFLHHILLDDVRWHIPVSGRWQGKVQLRSRHRAAAATVSRLGDNRWQVAFTEPQRAITPGQFAVFYEQDLVIGSGIIQGPDAGSRQR